MAVTRSQTQARFHRQVSNLPEELWLEIFSHLPGKDLARALILCRKFAVLRENAWEYACKRRWPRWYLIARAPQTQWRIQYDLFELREREIKAELDIQGVLKLQSVVNVMHRTVLTEWLAEVSWDWNLDSTVVFKAVRYLDHHLSFTEIKALDRFQLVGIACLRAAMRVTGVRKGVASEEAANAEKLDPQRFAHISDRTYSPAEVETLTRSIERETPDFVEECPNAKMFLRTFWYRALLESWTDREEMHIYIVASFLLQLGLLDLDCSGYAPSCVAAASLSTALEIFGKPSWSPALQRYTAYTTSDLEPCKVRLRHAQCNLAAEHLRRTWHAHHENHGYDCYRNEWARALLLINCRTPQD